MEIFFPQTSQSEIMSALLRPELFVMVLLSIRVSLQKFVYRTFKFGEEQPEIFFEFVVMQFQHFPGSFHARIVFRPARHSARNAVDSLNGFIRTQPIIADHIWQHECRTIWKRVFRGCHFGVNLLSVFF